MADNETIARLRRLAREGSDAAQRSAAATARAEEAEKRAALLEAGIRPGSPMAELVEKMHDGEWTGDAVRSTGIRYELYPSTPAAEIAGHQRADTMAADAHPVTGNPIATAAAELAALPKYGHPGWEEAANRAVEIAQRAGVHIDRSRPNATQWINPATGEPIRMTQDTPITR
jgi:hypothetical protein